MSAPQRKWLAALLALATLGAAGAQAGARGNLVLHGGAIYTLDPKQPWASALVIADGRIAYVGGDAGMRKYLGPAARAIDLRGRMVLPGFHDAHIHPMSGGMRFLRCRLDGLKTSRLVFAAVRACAAAKPKHEWLLGNGWLPEAFGGAGPTRQVLDALVPDRPAYLTTEDGYTGWANSKALSLAGIDLTGPNGTGVVKGDAIDRVRSAIPRVTQAEYREALRRTTAIANRFGITSMFDANVGEAIFDAYRAADLNGELTVRVVAAQRIDPARGPEQIDAMIARRNSVGGRRLRADAAKIFLDGEIDMHSAAMLAPYADTPGQSGEYYIQPAALNALVVRLDAQGFSVHMHAMGDGAVREGLDAIAQAIRINGTRDRRHQIAHIGVADPSDIARFGELGIAANFTPVWFPADDPAAASTEAVLGPERSRWIFPIASIAAHGGRIVASSDWPSPSMNPLDGIQAAVTRRPLDSSRPPRQPQERIDLAAILAAYTRDAAWGAREDAIDGTLEPGKAADLVVLDRNLFTVDVAKIHEARVLLTLLDGEPVYRDARFVWPSGSQPRHAGRRKQA